MPERCETPDGNVPAACPWKDVESPASILAVMQAEQKRQGQQLDRLLTCMQGDAEGRTPGLKTRVDRIEQSEALRKWWGRTIAAAVIGLVVNTIRGWMTTK